MMKVCQCSVQCKRFSAEQTSALLRIMQVDQSVLKTPRAKYQIQKQQAFQFNLKKQNKNEARWLWVTLLVLTAQRSQIIGYLKMAACRMAFDSIICVVYTKTQILLLELHWLSWVWSMWAEILSNEKFMNHFCVSGFSSCLSEKM